MDNKTVDVLAGNNRGFLGSSTGAEVMPVGMVEVTHDEFWAAVKAETRNIHPHPERHHTDWMVVGTRQQWGWTSRGFAGPFDHDGAPPEVYALRAVSGEVRHG